MQVSVIIITKDEQPRLRLSLLALGRQHIDWQRDAEIIIVDDCSKVPVGPADIPAGGPQPRLVRNDPNKGRSASRNELMSPDAVALHARLSANELGRGEQRHLRGTRFFKDPRTGEPWPGKEARVKSMGKVEPHLVTEEMVASGPYEKLLERSEVAIYPGAAPRKLYELEMGALRAGTIPLSNWMAASGHNFSIPRQAFLDAGGFPLDISINEHRELALRLCRSGMRVVPVEGAVSLHLTHREGYRDPMVGEDGWEQAFAKRHPFETQLMMRFWGSIAADTKLPPDEQLPTLEAVEALLRERAAAGQGGA
jgi:hypothetical protein